MLKLSVDGFRLRKIEKKTAKAEALAKKYARMSDAELQAKTEEFKDRLAHGETLDDIYPEAFATAREACKRVLGKYPYHVQMVGSTVLQGGNIAEMRTGEGKTITAVMAVYLTALEGKGVHVITVNEYLSERDAMEMGQVYNWLGLSVGLNKRELSKIEKKAAYACDITYTTNSEVGFDYLRDNMVKDKKDKVLRGLHFALVDEVDSILIDESRTPLIISGPTKDDPVIYVQADQFAKSLVKERDYTIDERSRTVQMTNNGINRAEKLFHLKDLYALENATLLHRINQALRANYIMAKDVDYVVQDDEVIIVDPNTGRLMKGREWSDGLHQAVSAKERVTLKEETITKATITYQNFFRLYDKLSGMTGTAKTEEEEFREIYNMYVYEIPTNKPVIRKDLPDLVFGTKKAKFEALTNEVVERHKKGQPVLVGTVAVETSELISKILTRKGVPHEVLNAKNHAREAEIVAKAGQKGAVTIATNMAGRGTDIKLGEGVAELGGLCVLGSERHESRRIDNQLRGRSGRQGDPGVSRFYVSVQDDLMVRFGSERLEETFASLGDEYIESRTITNSIGAAQKRVEGVNYDARKNLLKYDDVMRQQREVIYAQRDYILDHESIHDSLKKMFERVCAGIVANSYDYDKGRTDYKFIASALADLGVDDPGIIMRAKKGSLERLPERLANALWSIYEAKIHDYIDSIIPVERRMALLVIDDAWVYHIDAMDKLRKGISLRAYAQKDPYNDYLDEGTEMFNSMMNNIARQIVERCMKLRIVIKTEDEETGE